MLNWTWHTRSPASAKDATLRGILNSAAAKSDNQCSLTSCPVSALMASFLFDWFTRSYLCSFLPSISSRFSSLCPVKMKFLMLCHIVRHSNKHKPVDYIFVFSVLFCHVSLYLSSFFFFCDASASCNLNTTPLFSSSAF